MHMQSKLILSAAAVALTFGMGAGFLLGSQVAPVQVDSMLAEAQVVAQDRHVRWIGYQCGDDGAAVISREMPDINECKDIWLLNPDDTFKAPPRS
jgi:hypothetical protein